MHMSIPVRFAHLFYYVCRCCHKEVDRGATTILGGRKVSCTRRNVCPHCGVGGSVKAVGQGPPGAWVKFERWRSGIS